MGCDIHLFFERKNKEGNWEEVEIPNNLVPDDRNYDLFGFMAGVRSDVKPHFASRGIPDDCSYKQYLYEQKDCHSITYVYLDEILKAPWKEFELDNCYFKIFCEYIIPRICDWSGYLSQEEERNIRVIMGFDS